ncbi:hypothetical protein AVEN_78219-1 [Araneus ventricosus]|uniref:Uncharacterized protein n=1 Tax=Araneus ventricosus TaxID=182803 RepID=A0A4Y2J6R1_ARAVE|nr:hypothetical protein AVEN_52516-1 [Araneus ventricosus]GBM85615.1 hypothetical protein AVEN_78219-1 [Araneus ventricosus]
MYNADSVEHKFALTQPSCMNDNLQRVHRLKRQPILLKHFKVYAILMFESNEEGEESEEEGEVAADNVHLDVKLNGQFHDSVRDVPIDNELNR